MMKPDIPVLIYWSMAGCFSTALFLGLLGQWRFSRIAGVLGTLAAGGGVVSLIVIEQRLPLYGSFESIVYLSFILTLLELFHGQGKALEHALTLLTHGLVCLLLILQIRRPMAFNADFFMYDNLWVNLFFNLRLVAGAIFAWAAILFAAGAWVAPHLKDREIKAGAASMVGGRNFLLTAIAVYLASEWSGSIWCLNWMGDSWQWSRGFFKAGIIFLLVMAASHVPRSFGASDKTKAFLGSCPGIYMLWMLFQY